MALSQYLSPHRYPDIFAGDYDMQTWVTLTGGTKWAFRLDGFITRTCEVYTIRSTSSWSLIAAAA